MTLVLQGPKCKVYFLRTTHYAILFQWLVSAFILPYTQNYYPQVQNGNCMNVPNGSSLNFPPNYPWNHRVQWFWNWIVKWIFFSSALENWAMDKILSIFRSTDMVKSILGQGKLYFLMTMGMSWILTLIWEIKII